MSGYDWVAMLHMHVMGQAGIIQPTRTVCVGWSSDFLHRIGAAPLHAAMTPPTPRVDTWSPAKHPRLAHLGVDLRTSLDEGHQRGTARVLAQCQVRQFAWNHQGHQLVLP